MVGTKTVRTGTPKLSISLKVNGRSHQMEIEPQETLLDVLRKRLRLTGAKKSCDVQVCGTCSVLVDGQAVSACTYLAYEARGRAVTTIEGLAQGSDLHPVQQAFLEHNALQCGFCTPGMILTTVALLNDLTDPDEEEIKHYMRGNLCRCTGYRKILQAIYQVSRSRALPS